MPASPPKPRRIQWWFELALQNGSTKVVHRVEVDFGAVSNLLMKLPYRLMRGGRIAKGMEGTLANLSRLAQEGSR